MYVSLLKTVLAVNAKPDREQNQGSNGEIFRIVRFINCFDEDLLKMRGISSMR